MSALAAASVGLACTLVMVALYVHRGQVHAAQIERFKEYREKQQAAYADLQRNAVRLQGALSEFYATPAPADFKANWAGVLQSDAWTETLQPFLRSELNFRLIALTREEDPKKMDRLRHHADFIESLIRWPEHQVNRERIQAAAEEERKRKMGEKE